MRAVIVEPRPHPALSLVLCNLFQVLGGAHQQLGGGSHRDSHNLSVTILHGTQNREFVWDAIEEAGVAATAAITLAELPGVANLTVPEYSRLLCTTDFWRGTSTDTHVLVFQTDSILSETSPVRIEEFLDFAYTGAPWRHLPQFRTGGGNGGLSLRKTDAMVEACQCFAQDPFFRRRGIADLPEDLKFALYFRGRSRKQYYLPDRQTSARFSVESMYLYPRPLGIHKAWKRLSVREWQTLKKQDPWFAEIETWQG
jgi:hypothetical protein